MDKYTLNEICDIVAEEVVEKVQQKLSAMKPDLIRIISEASAEAVNRVIGDQNDQPVQRPVNSAGNEITTLSSAEVEDILSLREFHQIANGWIYYFKIMKDKTSKWGKIYKVRPDGTENQKIFNGKAQYGRPPFQIRNGLKLCFLDTDGEIREIKI